jgi:putative phosphoserine phosphatase / 1-acylglycerol-3-phosphate O-acyltransferase
MSLLARALELVRAAVTQITARLTGDTSETLTHADEATSHGVGASDGTAPAEDLAIAAAEVVVTDSAGRTAAFFDFDGTLISGFSAAVFARDRINRREVGLLEMLRLMRFAFESIVHGAVFVDVLRLAAESLRGWHEVDVIEVGERLYREQLAARVYPDARDLVRSHQEQGHTVVLVTSATRYQVAPAARELGIDHVVCNDFELDEGVITGAIRVPVVWGATKAEAAQRFAEEHGVDVSQSFFYADGDEDAAFMHVVGNPRPTNPRRGLERVALERGWPITRFAVPPAPEEGLVGTVRQLMILGVRVPAAFAGDVVGRVTRRAPPPSPAEPAQS